MVKGGACLSTKGGASGRRGLIGSLPLLLRGRRRAGAFLWCSFLLVLVVLLVS